MVRLGTAKEKSDDRKVFQRKNSKNLEFGK